MQDTPAQFRQAGLYCPAMMVSDLKRAFILLMYKDFDGKFQINTDCTVQLLLDVKDIARKFLGKNVCLE